MTRRPQSLLAATVVALLSCRKTHIPITIYTGEWSPYTTQKPDGVSAGSGGAFAGAARGRVGPPRSRPGDCRDWSRMSLSGRSGRARVLVAVARRVRCRRRSAPESVAVGRLS